MKKIFLFLVLLSSCTTMKILKYEREDLLSKNSEFEKQVVVKSADSDVKKTETPLIKEVTVLPTAPTDVIKNVQPIHVSEKVKEIAKEKTKIKKNKIKLATGGATPLVAQLRRQPDIEDEEGFNFLRRPQADPFRVGEKVVHSVSYFGTEAGRLTLQTMPYVIVNNKKSYHFQIGLSTSSLYSRVYSVDDTVDTFMDFESLIPHVFKLSLRETGKLMQSQGYFNHETLKANYWEKKYTEKDGQEDTKKSWELLPFSQNAFSGIFYMRIFDWKIGKSYSFRVSDDEKNVIFKGTALAKEKLSTDAGDFNAIKIKADIVSRGALSSAGNIYFWVSDDDRKLILRIEAEIKIGKLVSEIVEIEKGTL